MQDQGRRAIFSLSKEQIYADITKLMARQREQPTTADTTGDTVAALPAPDDDAGLRALPVG